MYKRVQSLDICLFSLFTVARRRKDSQHWDKFSNMINGKKTGEAIPVHALRVPGC
jgi:hypothetical protein